MNILEKIINHKREEIASQSKELSLEFYKKNCKKSTRDFVSAIKGKLDISLIAEVKKGSPSAGTIKEDLDVEATTKLYRRYASCISVLTDENFFFGSFENLSIVRKNTNLPILCKDFIISQYQIYKARYYGSDAILLIASVLDVDQMQEFYDLALSLGLNAIFEVHDETELKKVLKIKGLKIIGINNRNLSTFKTDIQNTSALVSVLSDIVEKKKGLDDLIIISESGIKSASDLLSLRGLVDGILVGSSIIGDISPDDKIYELSGLPEVKICGITNIKDAQMAMYYGASYLGVILAPSKRRVGLAFLNKLYDFVKNQDPNVKVVGVFVDEDLKILKEFLKFIDIVQLHGDEDGDYIEKLRELSDKPIWKVIGVKTKEDLDNLPNSCDKILLDTYSDNLKGGTGKSFDWSYIIKKGLRKHDIVLAGGVNPDNILEAREFADIIDVSSGVEQKPGKKSKKKLSSLFVNLRV